MQLFSVIPQALGKTSSPTFAGMTITGNSVFGLNSSVFQPTTDSTTFFQVLDADGGTPIFNVDSTNERVGIGTNAPTITLDVFGSGINSNSTGQIAILRVNRSDGKIGAIVAGSSGIGYHFDESGIFTIEPQTRAVIEGSSFPAFDKGIVIDDDGRLGVGTKGATSLIELFGTQQPYFTLHNSTHEDTDGGRETRLIFKGEQSGGEKSTLGRIEVGHDGSADDEKGYIDLFANTGSDGDSPTKVVRVTSAGRVAIGGINNPDGTLHVHTATAGTVLAWTGRRNLVVENNGTTGISILSPDASGAALVFGSPSDNNHAYIETQQSTGIMTIIAGAISTLTLLNGNLGINTSPTLALDVKAKAGITAIGGHAIKLTNNTGSNSVEGQVVEADDTDENSYKTADANSLDPIGVVYNAGIADGSEVWIVIAGIAEVLLDAGGCVHHDRLVTSATAGSADVSNSPAVAVHFQEIGHAIETVVGAGLAKAVLHFL